MNLNQTAMKTGVGGAGRSGGRRVESCQAKPLQWVWIGWIRYNALQAIRGDAGLQSTLFTPAMVSWVSAVAWGGVGIQIQKWRSITQPVANAPCSMVDRLD